LGLVTAFSVCLEVTTFGVVLETVFSAVGLVIAFSLALFGGIGVDLLEGALVDAEDVSREGRVRVPGITFFFDYTADFHGFMNTILNKR
jgi:hypothetical protein